MSNIYFYQIIIVVVAAIILYQGFSDYFKKKGGKTFFKLSIRIVVWGGMALIALFPSFSNVLANIIGIKGNINAVILTGFLLVFLMIFKLLSAIERLEQQISEITRHESLKELTNKK